MTWTRSWSSRLDRAAHPRPRRSGSAATSATGWTATAKAPSRASRCATTAANNLGEHLAPLYRYLQKQVNRPWAKVYGELCAGLDKRSVVQSHLFQHIDGKVEVNTVWKDDAVWVRSWRGLEPLSQARCEMYVHPRTGILLVNRASIAERRQRKQARRRAQADVDADRRLHVPGRGSDVQWHRVDGIWWEITVAPLVPRTKETRFDVLSRRDVHWFANDAARYGGGARYAVSKRQLDGRTLRRHGLTND
jgi:hypothetical protein